MNWDVRCPVNLVWRMLWWTAKHQLYERVSSHFCAKTFQAVAYIKYLESQLLQCKSNELSEKSSKSPVIVSCKQKHQFLHQSPPPPHPSFSDSADENFDGKLMDLADTAIVAPQIPTPNPFNAASSSVHLNTPKSMANSPKIESSLPRLIGDFLQEPLFASDLSNVLPALSTTPAMGSHCNSPLVPSCFSLPSPKISLSTGSRGEWNYMQTHLDASFLIVPGTTSLFIE